MWQSRHRGMRDLMHRVREWLGVPHTPDWEREAVERRLEEQERRLARIDATLPRARYHQTYPHPHRRAGD